MIFNSVPIISNLEIRRRDALIVASGRLVQLPDDEGADEEVVVRPDVRAGIVFGVGLPPQYT